MNDTEQLDQRSDDWLQARVGKVTASRLSDVTARIKAGWGASRKNYMAELVAERLTGQPAARFFNAAMQWGIDNEEGACVAYSFGADIALSTVGFVQHPHIPMSGASPDRLVGDDGLLEVKCPNTATHIETLLGGSIDNKYMLQMQWQMACTNRAWCDFGSFDPRMPMELQFHCQRVMRNDALIGSLERDVEEFLAELSVMVNELKAKYGITA